MNDSEKSAVKLLKKYINLFYFYLKANSQEFEVKSKQDILEIIKKVGAIEYKNNQPKYNLILELIENEPEIENIGYAKLIKKLKLAELNPNTPIRELADDALRYLQENHTEFAKEFTRTLL